MPSATTTKKKKYKIVDNAGQVVETIEVSEGEIALPFPVVEDPNAMPPQMEGPALKFVPGFEELFEEPFLISPVIGTQRIAIKCEGPKGKRWVELDSSYLREGWNMPIKFIQRITIVDVQFASQVVKEGGGCGVSPTNTRIGYATGKMLTGGHVSPKAQTFMPKYDRNTGRFMLDGLEVIGAKAMILGDGCIALIVDPIFKERATT